MMKLAFDILYPEFDSRYVYFSRKSIRQALLCKCEGYRQSLRYLTDERYISFGKLLRYYGFDKNESARIAQETGVNEEKEYEVKQLSEYSELEHIYNDYCGQIRVKSQKQCQLLKAYLEENDFFGMCPIVDIGWHGSMQYYLEVFKEINKLDAIIKGYYVGINSEKYPEEYVSGYLFNGIKDPNRKKILCFLGGYEKLFQSREGSTIGYYNENGRIQPLLDTFEYIGEPGVSKMIDIWQDSALKVLKTDNELKYKTKQELTGPLINFGMNPPKWGIDIFRDFYIDDGGKQFFISQKKVSSYSIKELKHALSNSVWKTGFMKSLFGIPLPYFLIYKVLRK